MDAQKEKINIIWTCGDFEIDWFKDVIFQDVNYEIHMNPEMSKVLPNSIIVLNGKDEGRLNDFLNLYKCANLKYGIIHLSDEVYATPTYFYKDAVFVLRNYYSKKYAEYNNVDFLPLGCKKGLKYNQFLQTPATRKYTWNFIGQVLGKPTRPEMCNALVEIPKGFLYITQQWDDPNACKTDDYQRILEDSVFTACPRGWINPDSFRVYEALEAGSIPIVENINYFKALYGDNIPFPSIRDWTTIKDIIKDNKNYIVLQQHCLTWWRKQKKLANAKFKAGVEKLCQQNKLRS